MYWKRITSGMKLANERNMRWKEGGGVRGECERQKPKETKKIKAIAKENNVWMNEVKETYLATGNVCNAWLENF